jgi:hypothetical protein
MVRAIDKMPYFRRRDLGWGTGARGQWEGLKMNTPSFGIKEINDFQIEVVHLNEGHNYTMSIVKDQDGRRFLNGNIIDIGVPAKHQALLFAAHARRFAEAAARKAGKNSPQCRLRPTVRISNGRSGTHCVASRSRTLSAMAPWRSRSAGRQRRAPWGSRMLTGYGGGLDRKRWLLAHESACSAARGESQPN